MPAHVDHLHPDSGIALATAADGEALTRRCFGDRVAWVPWRRPGFQLGLDIAAIQRDRPGGHRRDPRRARHHGLGRDLRGVRGELARDHPDRRAVHRRRGAARPVRSDVCPTSNRCPDAERHARAAALLPLAARPRLDRPAAGRALHRQRRRPRLPRARSAPAARRARHLVPGPLPADEGAADGPRPASVGADREVVERLRELHAAYREDYAAYYARHADARQPADARRRPGHRPRARRRDVQLRRDQADRPRRRRVLRQRDQRHARRGSRLHLRARSPSRRSSASSTGRSRRPSSAHAASPKPLAGRVAFVTGAASGIGKAIAQRLAARGRLRRRRRHRRGERRSRRRRARWTRTWPSARSSPT